MDEPINQRHTLSESFISNSSFSRKEDIERWMEPYGLNRYEYEEQNKPFRMIANFDGIEFPSDGKEPMCLQYQLYLRAIRGIIGIMIIYAVVNSFPIYFLALKGMKNDEFFSFYLPVKLYYIIVNPSTFVHASGKEEWVTTTLKPILLLVTFSCFVVELFLYENSLATQVAKLTKRNMFCSVLVTFEEEVDDIDEWVRVIMGKGVKFESTLAHNYKGIEEKVEHLFNLNIAILVKEARGLQVYKLYAAREDKIKEIRNLVRQILKDESQLPFKCALISFSSYGDCLRFIKYTTETRGYGKSLGGLKTEPAPDPCDINWNHIGRKKNGFEYALQVGMGIIYFAVFPAATYFVQKVLSVRIAKTFLEIQDKKDHIEGNVLGTTYEFIWVRVLLSSGFAMFCAKTIEFYFSKRVFSTYSGWCWSFYTFYNFYYLLNQIVADFYGLISSGNANFSTETTYSKKTLVLYSGYIFSSALKVGIILIINPYCLKFVEYIPKIYLKIMIWFKLRRSFVIDKVRSDLPILHQFPEMAGFVTQCIFFVAFFHSFLMPVLDFLIIIGLIIFYFIERYSLKKWEARRKGLNVKNIKMIYLVSMLGFLIAQPLSIGNSSSVLQYYNDPNIDNASRLVLSVMNYTTLVLLLLVSFCVLYYFKARLSHERILKKVHKIRGDAELESGETEGMFESNYNLRNPLWKAKNGFYDRFMEAEFNPNIL